MCSPNALQYLVENTLISYYIMLQGRWSLLNPNTLGAEPLTVTIILLGVKFYYVWAEPKRVTIVRCNILKKGPKGPVPIAIVKAF